MSEHDAALAVLLDEVLPRGEQHGDWQRVLEDARRRRPRLFRSRLALVGAIVAVATVVPLTALAVSEDWWFLGSASMPAPAGSVVVVKSGDWNGVPWTLTAYRSQTNTICFAFTPNSPSGRPATPDGGHSAAAACGRDLRGIGDAAVGATLHSILFLGSSGMYGAHAFPGFAVGPSAPDVTQIKILLAGGTNIVTDTFAAPAELGVPARFYVAAVPSGERVQAIVALDASGRNLEELTVSEPPPLPPQTRPGVTGGVEWAAP
jgi:hypothetical protein